MASQESEEIAEQTEEAEPTQDEEDLRISPAEEMPADGDGEPEQLLLPWDRFSAWLHCICVVGFDLELGQAVEVSCSGLQCRRVCVPLQSPVGTVCGL